MGIKEELLNVLQLQREYDSSPTAAMRARGLIVKHALPELIGALSDRLIRSAGVEPGDFLLQGRDGIGRKSQVPWIRFGSKSRSPSAAIGWYVVWLFREDGSGVYLALSHASTEKVDGAFIPRSPTESARLTRWGREVVGSELTEDERVFLQISLGRGSLAKAYESTTVAAYFYTQSGLPNDSQLLEDMEAMARRLGKIYVCEPAQLQTGETSQDVIAVMVAVKEATSGRPNEGQGFSLTATQRRAVELRAMSLATDHFKSNGYQVEDTSAQQPYDLVVRKEEEAHYIEVKGTTGLLGDIVLTKNEVEHHRKHYPMNGLFIVHGIELKESVNGTNATGGKSHFERPWKIVDEKLLPIAYRYRTS